LRRRVAGWRAAERREQAILAAEGPLAPAAALNAALELYELLAVDFRHEDVLRSREIELARHAWQMLRTRLRLR
jgi:hypothetical protein